MLQQEPFLSIPFPIEEYHFYVHFCTFLFATFYAFLFYHFLHFSLNSIWDDYDTIIGENVWIGPNATLSNKIKIGNNAFVSLGAVLINVINDGERVAGNFAYDTKKFMKEFKMKKNEE